MRRRNRHRQQSYMMSGLRGALWALLVVLNTACPGERKEYVLPGEEAPTDHLICRTILPVYAGIQAPGQLESDPKPLLEASAGLPRWIRRGVARPSIRERAEEWVALVNSAVTPPSLATIESVTSELVAACEAAFPEIKSAANRIRAERSVEVYEEPDQDSVQEVANDPNQPVCRVVLELQEELLDPVMDDVDIALRETYVGAVIEDAEDPELRELGGYYVYFAHEYRKSYHFEGFPRAEYNRRRSVETLLAIVSRCGTLAAESGAAAPEHSPSPI